MNGEASGNRHYGVSSLPLFREEPAAVENGMVRNRAVREKAVRNKALRKMAAAKEADRKEILLALYEQICSSWHLLIDIRFKLLAFVPAVSTLSIAALLSTDGPVKGLSPAVRTGVAALGLLTTTALFLYDRRNSQLHDDLISRGRRIEDELGVHTGQFRGRLKPSNPFVKHDLATGLIYGSAFLAWTLAILALWLQW
jgi:hypothetical protein